MSDEATFLSAITKTPEDATPRLVFADWLDEHDDFRGEFVRTGIEYERTPPYDPRRFQFGARLRELHQSPAFRAWLPTSPAFKWGWRRGFLTLFADTGLLQAEDPLEVAARLGSAWIERVEFNGSFSSSPVWENTYGLARTTRELQFHVDNYGPGALTRLREWPHLRDLHISYLMKAWPGLAALPHLRVLTLDNPDWTMMPELHKARLPELEVLGLDKEWEDDLPHWGTCFPKLRALTLTQYNAYPDEQCAHFAECPQLRHLALHQRYLPFKSEGLKALTKLTELRSLTLGPWPRVPVDGLANLTKLERLEGHGKLGSARGLESLKGLRWLSLGATRLTKSVAKQIVRLPQLSRLDLDCDAFEPGAIAALAKAPALRVLTLDLDEESIPISELCRLEGLEYLRFRPANRAPEDLPALQTALPACRIVTGYGDQRDDLYDWI